MQASSNGRRTMPIFRKLDQTLDRLVRPCHKLPACSTQPHAIVADEPHETGWRRSEGDEIERQRRLAGAGRPAQQDAAIAENERRRMQGKLRRGA